MDEGGFTLGLEEAATLTAAEVPLGEVVAATDRDGEGYTAAEDALGTVLVEGTGVGVTEGMGDAAHPAWIKGRAASVHDVTLSRGIELS